MDSNPIVITGFSSTILRIISIVQKDDTIIYIKGNLWIKKGIQDLVVYEPDTTRSPYSSSYRQKCNRYHLGSSIRVNYKSDALCNWIPLPLDPFGEWTLRVMTIYQRNYRYKRRQGDVEFPRSVPVRK